MNEEMQELAALRRDVPPVVKEALTRQYEAEFNILRTVEYPSCVVDRSASRSKTEKKLAKLLKLAEDNKELLSIPMPQLTYRGSQSRDYGINLLIAFPSPARQKAIEIQIKAGIGKANVPQLFNNLDDTEPVISGHGVPNATPNRPSKRVRRTSTPLYPSDKRTSTPESSATSVEPSPLEPMSSEWSSHIPLPSLPRSPSRMTGIPRSRSAGALASTRKPTMPAKTFSSAMKPPRSPARSATKPPPSPARSAAKPHSSPARSAAKPPPSPARSAAKPHSSPARSAAKPHPSPSRSATKPTTANSASRASGKSNATVTRSQTLSSDSESPTAAAFRPGVVKVAYTP